MDIRKLKPEEYQAAEKMIREELPDVMMPKMEHSFGKFRDGELKAVIGVHRLLFMDPVVAEDGEVSQLLTWMDGKLDPENYYFFVSEKSERFEKLIERQYGDVVEGFCGKLYRRVRK